MKSKDQLKLEIMYKVSKGEMRVNEACKLLNTSERTVRRYLKSFKEKGIYFIHHGNKGKIPRNKTPDFLKQDVQELIKQKYFDFNITHLREKLIECHNITLNHETLRRWCHEIGYVKHAQKRQSKPRFYRQRMSQSGLLVQMDGSHHRWFEDRKLCLMSVIDDATGEIYARFYEGETTLACMDFLNRYVEEKGVAQAYYTDKAGLFGGIKRSNFSQIERALGEIGSQIIYADSPEAKGRVERLFKTLQDRLVPEMRLRGITTLEEANRYLDEEYLLQHNHRYKVLAHNPVNGFKALPGRIKLSEVFCIKEFRIVGRDHTVSIGGERYMLANNIRYSIHKQKLLLIYDKWGCYKAYFAGKEVKLIKIKKLQKMVA